MSDKQLPEHTGDFGLKEPASPPQENSKSKRRLLKSALAVPVIMTLHSGAALARSSNIIGSAPLEEAATMQELDGTERLICAEPGLGAGEQQLPGQFDLGDAPIASLGDGAVSLQDQANTCQAGGGAIISTTAFTSIDTRVGISIINM